MEPPDRESRRDDRLYMRFNVNNQGNIALSVLVFGCCMGMSPAGAFQPLCACVKATGLLTGHGAVRESSSGQLLCRRLRNSPSLKYPLGLEIVHGWIVSDSRVAGSRVSPHFCDTRESPFI